MLQITLLGEQRVEVAGVPIEALRSTRTFDLLAYLVVHRGAPQPRRHLAGVLWPDSTDAQARTNLRRELHQLRAALPDADRCLAIASTSVGWQAAATCRSDLADFEDAAEAAERATDGSDDAAFRAAGTRAVRSYGGELLPGSYADWVAPERERLQRRCLALLDRLAVVAAGASDVVEATEFARRRIEIEPFEEAGYRRLIELQVRGGDRAAALRTYHRCATVLDRDLGLRPDTATEALYEQLVGDLPVLSEGATPPRRAARLVGRDEPLELLRGSWRAVAAGRPRMMAISGEAGVGKTRLAAELAADVRQTAGRSVAVARCFATPEPLALAPVAEWLRSPSLRARSRAIDPLWRTEVARLVPEFGTGERLRTEPFVDAWQRSRFLEGLARAVLAGRSPTLLVLDDLQWCDGETLAWLELLLDLDPAAPLLVVATLRSEELDDNPELVRFRRRLVGAGTLHELELRPLDVGASAELAASLLGRPLGADEAHRLQEETGGYPLYVVESTRQGPGASSRSRAVLDGRIAQLGPRALELAGVAAAVGRDFSTELLGTVTRVGEDELIAGVDELWRRRLLREHSPTTYDFSHDLLRAAAYARLPPPRRRHLHRRIAEALRQLHADDLGAVAAVIARQYELGGCTLDAVAHHVAAAETAAGVFALEDAVHHYGRALELLADAATVPDRVRQEVTVREAMLPHLNALRGYAAPEVGTCLERVVAGGRTLGEPEIVVRGEAATWAYLFVRGRVDASAALAERLLVQGDVYPDLAGQIHLANGGSQASLGRSARAVDHFTQAELHTRGDEVFLFGFRVRVMVRAWRAHPLWLLGRAGEAAASAADALAVAAELEHPYSQAMALAYGAMTSHLLGDRDTTADRAAEGRDLCARYGFAYYGDCARVLEGWATGGAAGEVRIRQALDRLRGQHAGARSPFYLALLADVLTGQGRTAEARRVLASARSVAGTHGDRWWLPELWRLEARLLPRGERQPVLAEALRAAREQGSRALELRAATDVASEHLACGRGEDADLVLRPIRAASVTGDSRDLAAADEVLLGART